MDEKGVKMAGVALSRLQFRWVECEGLDGAIEDGTEEFHTQIIN